MYLLKIIKNAYILYSSVCNFRYTTDSVGSIYNYVTENQGSINALSPENQWNLIVSENKDGGRYACWYDVKSSIESRYGTIKWGTYKEAIEKCQINNTNNDKKCHKRFR